METEINSWILTLIAVILCFLCIYGLVALYEDLSDNEETTNCYISNELFNNQCQEYYVEGMRVIVCASELKYLGEYYEKRI